jgi:K+-transporting ATPase ATPase C chain
MKIVAAEMKTAFVALALFTLLLGGVYPAAVWMIGRALYPGRAEGSLITGDEGILGSTLLGREFSGDRFFHPRPSAAGGGYDAARSGGSNLGPLSRKLIETVRARAGRYRAENGLPPDSLVPADAVTDSASGLDPHISPANARLQAGRVARARGRALEDVLHLVSVHTEGRTLGLLGMPRVNVLALNLDLEGKRFR